jgi:uncharacterized membrane-anchored protein YhcB (DUF1043 family)
MFWIYILIALLIGLIVGWSLAWMMGSGKIYDLQSEIMVLTGQLEDASKSMGMDESV